MTAKKMLRPEIEKALPLGLASLSSSPRRPMTERPHWAQLMELARDTAEMRGERVKVVGGWVARKPEHWVYVIECASWCGCRRGRDS